MSRSDHPSLVRLVALLALIGSLSSSSFAADPVGTRQDYGPDPASVRRYGPAYKYPQAGWTVLHVEGEPYERGYQHGRLMAAEIDEYLKSLAHLRSPGAPDEGWKSMRTTVDALFLRRYDKEYLEEMKGIADGASAAGATFEGRPIDLLDIAAINSDIEVGSLDSALEALPNGLEGKKFREPSVGSPKAIKGDHCSAFVATGPATEGGQVAVGHITMWMLATSRFFNLWLDVKPSDGHRVVMQTCPGGIQSGMDYYQNDAGLVVVETTIGQTAFEPDGLPLASRIRKAVQYGDSIDSFVALLSNKNNGLYTNEWLLADTKTNEIAMFELGTKKSKLWRSSKKEWFGGAEGFYWGCNNGKDIDVRLETLVSVDAKPANMVWRPSDRDQTWLALYNESKGKINADFGLKALTTPPLALSSSLDAKFTTTSLAKDLKSWALFGPPIGRSWEPTDGERTIPGIRPLISNDWTILTGEAPPTAHDDAKAAVDLTGLPSNFEVSVHPNHKPIWRGTILPRTDADTWLAAAFADYETIVAIERAVGDETHDCVQLALQAARSRYLSATRRLGKDVPLAKIKAEVATADWYEIAAGKGVLLLAAVRAEMGDIAFVAMMDEFGRMHAGNAVETARFRAHAEKAAPEKPLKALFDRWLNETGLPGDNDSSPWAVNSFDDEPKKALIVYGTLKEVHANGETARRLQKGIATRWSNVIVPIKADVDLTDDDWKSHHILLVGRPATNAATARAATKLPVSFGPASFTLKGETYANPGTALIIAGDNPLTPRYSIVLYAGNGADSTWHAVENLGGHSAEAVLLGEGSPPRRMVVKTPTEKDVVERE